MHVLDQRLLGIAILLLLALLVAVKRVATGSVLDRPQGSFLVQLVNIFNLLFLLVVNPAAAVALLTRRVAALDPTHITIDTAWIRTTVEIVGLASCPVKQKATPPADRKLSMERVWAGASEQAIHSMGRVA